MVLIISQYNDGSTNELIDWLSYYNISFLRLNPFEKLKIKKFSISKKGTEILCEVAKGILFNFLEVRFCFYRNGFYVLDFKDSQLEEHLQDSMNSYIDEAKNEKKYLDDFLQFILSISPSLLSLKDANTNKLRNLFNANELGLLIPASLVTSYKEQLIQFWHENNESIVCKSMTERPFSKRIDNYNYVGYTSLLSIDDVLGLKDYFFPTFFQAFVKIEYEIRVFFIDNHFYPMAIFNYGGNLDYRNFSGTNPNRFVRIKLHKEIRTKLCRLFKKLNLKTGY